MSDTPAEPAPDATASELPGLRERTEPPRDDTTVAFSTRFEIYEELAHGGGGRIMRAWDSVLDRDVALKIPLRAGADGRLARESMITAKLEHPAIVPVHAAGKFPNGTPFYAMKLVGGRSLRDEIARAGSLSARLGLLPQMIAVCDAIAYAHSKGVIHRDLKPSNVLVGQFGEATVIDWGMAKSKHADRDDVLPGDLSPAETVEQTRTGAVLGTPGYMPPEQARGEKVDERADVYSLGAMVYHLLTGLRPYPGASSAAILREVLEGPPVAVEEREPRLSPELAAIVRRAMAREPADRYASAQELSEDLKRHQTGRLVAAHDYSTSALVRRWLWKYRAPVAVALLALAILAMMGTLAFRRVVAEQHRANQQRAAAEELVDFMLVDLRTRLRQVGKLALLDGVASRVDGYYEKVKATWYELDGDELARRVDARRVLADVRESQGNMSMALEVRREIVALARRLSRLEPRSENRAQRLARALIEIAKLETNVGELAAARASATEALVICDMMMSSTSERSAWDAHRAAALTQLAYVDFHESNPRDVDLLGEASTIQRRLLNADPENEEVAMDAIGTITQLAKAKARGNHLTDAWVQASRAHEIAARFAKRDEGDVEWQLRLARATMEVGSSLQALGRLDEAIAVLEKARDIRFRLVTRDPQNLNWKLALVQSESLVAEGLMDHGDVDKARGVIAEAVKTIEELVSKEPQKLQWKQWQFFVYQTAGKVDSGRQPEGATWYRKALQVVEPLAADGTSKVAQDWTALMLITLSEIQLQSAIQPETIPNLEKAIGILGRRIEEDPSNRNNIQNWAGAQAAMAAARLILGNPSIALQHLIASNGVGEILMAEVRDALVHCDVAERYARTGSLVAELARDIRASRASYERASDILRRLEDEGRLPARARKDLANMEAALAKMKK